MDWKGLLTQIPLGIALALYYMRQRRAAQNRANYEKRLNNICQEITGFDPVPDEFITWAKRHKLEGLFE